MFKCCIYHGVLLWFNRCRTESHRNRNELEEIFYSKENYQSNSCASARKNETRNKSILLIAKHKHLTYVLITTYSGGKVTQVVFLWTKYEMKLYYVICLLRLLFIDVLLICIDIFYDNLFCLQRNVLVVVRKRKTFLSEKSCGNSCIYFGIVKRVV